MAEFQSSIARANQVVPFASACRYAGMTDVPAPRDTGSRAYCPFGELNHPDEGRDKALRIYYDHGFCFAEWLYLTPVRIYAMMHELDDEYAARELLVQHGDQPASYEERWAGAAGFVLEPDRNALAEALRTWLSATYADWNNRQYDPLIAGILARCLGLLSRVVSESDCEMWLKLSKQAMTQHMRRAG